MSMGSLQFHSKQWIWDGACYPQLFGLGGIMITVAILGLSTTYFGGIGAPVIPYYFWPDLGTLYKRGKSRKRPVRVYMDGCFDLMHYGHANALRQAKALGDELVVGVVSDEEIVANKGPPVLSMEERLTLVSGLKWVDEVITNAPYEINEKFMNILFNDYKIDYIIHGDDPCLLPDGTDAYALAKKVGRYKQIKRTEGVSSTDIVGRILSLRSTKLENGTVNASSHEQLQNGENTPVGGSVKSHLSNFLPTSRRIVQFSNGKLVRRVQSQEGDAAGKEVSATPKKIFQIVHQTIEALLSIPSPELALRLYLQSAEAANDCDLEPVAYEFFTQAFILYEEEVADSKAQVTSLHLIIGTLQRMNIFGVENRDTLTHKATGFSAILQRKADQCRAVYACSHLFWVDDHNGIKDGERVLLCLKRALRIANAAEQMASATKGGGELATLFIEILNKYLYFFEKGNPQITSSDIQGLIELITTEKHNENSPSDPAADAFFASTVQYINFQKQKGGAISERYEPVVV